MIRDFLIAVADGIGIGLGILIVVAIVDFVSMLGMKQ